MAGCGVTEGEMIKVAEVRVMRGPRIVFEGKLKTLKSFKDNVQARPSRPNAQRPNASRPKKNSSKSLPRPKCVHARS